MKCTVTHRTTAQKVRLAVTACLLGAMTVAAAAVEYFGMVTLKTWVFLASGAVFLWIASTLLDYIALTSFVATPFVDWITSSSSTKYDAPGARKLMIASEPCIEKALGIAGMLSGLVVAVLFVQLCTTGKPRGS